MGRVLPSLLVVLVAFSSTLAQTCNKGDVEVNESHDKVITTKDIEGREGSVNLFVQTRSEFQGVRLDVHGVNGSQHSAWFPAAAGDCFPRNDDWKQLSAWMENDPDNNKLTLGYETRTCVMGCVIDKPFPNYHSLSVAAHGSSSWILKIPPSTCSIKYLSDPGQPKRFLPCLYPPTNPSTESQTTVLLIVVITIVSCMVLMIVVSVLYCKFHRKK